MSGFNFAEIEEMKKARVALEAIVLKIRTRALSAGTPHTAEGIDILKMLCEANTAMIAVLEARDRAFTAALNHFEKLLVEAGLADTPSLDG